MSGTLKEFDNKFRVHELMIVETEHWRWSVRPVHSTLGAGILSLRRFCTSMSDATVEEMADLATISSILEDRLNRTFAPEKMNYIMLMMVDDHLHFHVLPRYSKEIKFAEHTWVDEGWPALPVMSGNSNLSNSEMLFSIRDALK